MAQNDWAGDYINLRYAGFARAVTVVIVKVTVTVTVTVVNSRLISD